jgi:antitoxin VapB
LTTIFYTIYTFLYFIYNDQEKKMALSIRNAKAEKLARELAAESGENITQAITRALEERLQRLRNRSTAIDMTEEIIRTSRRCSEIPDQDMLPHSYLVALRVPAPLEACQKEVV